MSGLFNIKFKLKPCLPTPNCSKLDSSSLISALFVKFIKTFITSFMTAPMRGPFMTL